MTAEDLLRGCFVSLEVNGDFSEAVLLLRDGSRLQFCHRVGERWAQALGAGEKPADAALAGQVLARLARFRLNGRHLDIHFEDGGRWEARFGDSNRDR